MKLPTAFQQCAIPSTDCAQDSYRLLNALVAQYKNYPFGVNTKTKLKNVTATSDSDVT